MSVMQSSQLKWKDLFPTPWSFIIFIVYMALFINQGILVTASQNAQKGYSYNTVTAVLLTEVIKLVFSSAMFVHRHVKVRIAKKKWAMTYFLCVLVRNSIGTFLGEVSKNFKVFILYMIPAFLYCLYNNLAYKNLATFDPTTYFILLQLRVVVTGICFQILFKKNLSMHQWASLVLLTFGCMVKELNFDYFTSTKENSVTESVPTVGAAGVTTTIGLFLILLQVVSSSGAGVFNEFLLKDVGAHVPVLVQNTCLYLDSIFWNVVVLGYQGNLSEGLNYTSLQIIFGTPAYLAVILNNAAIGIVTSFFLAQMNSILKTFASALELMFTAVLCWMIFGIPIHINTIVAIAIVTLAIYLYSMQPVVNRGKIVPSKSDIFEKDSLLQPENV